MVTATKRRVGAGLVVMSWAAAWASGCGGSVDKSLNAAGAAGQGEAGVAEAGAVPVGGGGQAGQAGQAGEPSLPEAGSAGEAGQAGQAGAGTTPGPRDPFIDWATTQATALCERDLKCGRVYSVASCVGAALNKAPYAALYGGSDHYDQQVEHYTLASSAAQQTCLKDIAAGGCEDGLATSCSQVLVALEPLPKGALCRSSNYYLPPLPCAAGLTCSRRSRCSTCVDAVPPVALNGACSYEDDCAPGLTCKSAGNNSYTCQQRAKLDESCSTMAHCASGLACANSATCSAYVLEGKACSNEALCLPGLACGADKRCHPLPPYGPEATCMRHPRAGVVTDSCANWCLFASPTAATGKCGDPAPSPGVPTACSRFASGPLLACPFGSYHDEVRATNADGISDDCTCLPRRALGAACTEAAQCLSFRCAAGDSGNANGSVCSELLPAGATCTKASGECAGTCNIETKQCEGPTVCAG